jgi:hypothetical protein
MYAAKENLYFINKTTFERNQKIVQKLSKGRYSSYINSYT